MKINLWFENGCNYEEGVLLYSSVKGCNQTLLKNFKRKETPALKEKLKYELKKYLVEPKVLLEVNKKVVTSNKFDNEKPADIPPNKKTTLLHELPEELRPVLLEANQLFREMCLLKVQLNELPPVAEEEALKIQLAIVGKRKKNELCWKRIDYYKEHKVLIQPKPRKIEQIPPARQLQKEQSLYAAISKLKKRVEANKKELEICIDFKEKNKLKRKIQKQESNILDKEEELQQLKDLINNAER